MGGSVKINVIGMPREELPDLMGAGPPATGSYLEDLFEPDPNDPHMPKGDPLGTAAGAFHEIPGDRAICNVVLHFDGSGGGYPEGQVNATGSLPFDGKKLGSGRIGISGGSGGELPVAGPLDIEVWNPKKYSTP